MPEKSPGCRDLKPVLLRSSTVTSANSAVVTSAQSDTPAIAATIASRTCSVRPQTPDLGVAGPASAAVLTSPPAFTVRNWNV